MADAEDGIVAIDDLIKQWQRDSSTVIETPSEHVARGLFEECMQLFSTIVSIVEKVAQLDQVWIKDLRRTYDLLLHWGIDSGISSGRLDIHLQHSRRERRATLVVLLAIAKLLTKG